MLRSKKRWKVEGRGHSLEQQFVTELKITPLVANLLLNRGISSVEEARNFLYIEKMNFHDPFMMKGMRIATERIHQAIREKEKILIFGDYDADGVSSTAVMVHTLKRLKAEFDFYIPNRFTEGYGPNEPALRKAKDTGYSLVVTVDTGISAVHEANVAKEIGLDFIVTDHHEPPPVLPDAYAIVNPKQEDCMYPFKGLAGVGVAFKLAHALLGQVPEDLLDIVVIGTVADLVPLVDENRLITKKGIKALENTNRPGLQALKKITGMIDKELNADHVGFGIGPRINAAGRLDSATPAVELLICEDKITAERLATDIDELNKVRQGIVNEITEEAVEIVENLYTSLDDHKVLIVAKEGWNAGVIGIVASRLVERYYRPTIVLTIDKEKGLAKGSARSIEGFDMFKNLSECRDILPHFGGHPMAAGLTMKLADLEELRSRLNVIASEVLTASDYIPITKIDIGVSLKDVTLPVIEEMSLLAPFGVSNPTPKIMVDQVNLSQMKRIGSEENHLKMLLEQNGNTVDCVGFHLGYLFEEISMSAQISAVGTLSINEWNGHCKPQLMLEDVAVNDWQLFDCRGNGSFKKYSQLPAEKVVCIYFDESTLDALKIESKYQLVHVPYGIEAPELDFSEKYLFLLDLPFEKSQLEIVLSKCQKPERIYPIFHHNENHFFTTIPSRENFKWFYAFLTKQQTFDLNKYGAQLAKHKGWSTDTIDFMVKVFFDLEFVTIKNGLISLSTNIEKKDLNHSKTYKRKQEQAKLENDLYYSSYNELKQWFEQLFLAVQNVE
ncbi:single-stranded-DNA-specific exonuclease RecJ [Anaerobacillus isosaccharinicus]|uniref:Single-stranded-DNA-specific exonuclease RecJ n=1 Tax=Anaerobacillus isosaccharinicus TaxID=1532552 RepID=A0A1S2KU05_9BACI|nr:single-stranded-DNA-specific exonuclease RecJ [Anaerobacillus isosaccharinicus]MBA5585366.1 single-stranded-DNA-specific exonuclease RecJ [Anaerobacillus isosaccharinicus]QOY36313.1 single-stranded-DNA-specific exonuclease RecJ [Anaerobacillus isosaccharinicus]